MPLQGFTTDALPGRVLTPDDLLALLASSDNPTDFTHAMAAAMVHGHRGDDALSATSLVSTCPREYKLKQAEPYTLSLEAGFYAMDGTFFHAMVEGAPPPEGQEVIREKRFAKRIRLPDGVDFFLPGRMDEIVLNYRDGRALVRDYKRTKSVPKYGRPWSNHIRQLNLYRMILSDYPEPPVCLPDGVEFWEAGAEWQPAESIDVGWGEVVYRDMDQSKRIGVGPGSRANFEPVEQVYEWAADRLALYLGERITDYVSAVTEEAKGGYGFKWKCPYCPVVDACRNLWLASELPFKAKEAIKRLEALGYEVRET